MAMLRFRNRMRAFVNQSDTCFTDKFVNWPRNFFVSTSKQGK